MLEMKTSNYFCLLGSMMSRLGLMIYVSSAFSFTVITASGCKL